MNALYIGPYREKSILGLSSRNHIYSLRNKCSLTIRPIFLSDNVTIPEIDQELLDLEQKIFLRKKYDFIVQYAPIDYIIPFNLVSNKNYCIPIIPYIKNNYMNTTYSRVLKTFNMILFDSQYDSTFIKNNTNLNSKNIKSFRYSETITDATKPEKLIKNKKYKFYTFISKENIQDIKRYISAFILLKKKINLSMLFMVCYDKNIVQEINKHISLLQQSTKLYYMNNYIKPLVINCFESEILGVHEAFDCCLDFRRFTNYGLNSDLPKLYNNSIISNDNMDINQDLNVEDNIWDIDNIYSGINISDLSEKMSSSINTRPIRNNDNTPTLDSLLCK
jgi:hypothetical protein